MGQQLFPLAVPVALHVIGSPTSPPRCVVLCVDICLLLAEVWWETSPTDSMDRSPLAACKHLQMDEDSLGQCGSGTQ